MEHKELHLVLKHKWFYLIEAGLKDIEYRSISPYYLRKFFDYPDLSKIEAWQMCEDFKSEQSFMRDGLEEGTLPVRPFMFVVFHRGYSNVTIRRWFLKIDVGRLGLFESKDFPDGRYFRIHFSKNNL